MVNRMVLLLMLVLSCDRKDCPQPQPLTCPALEMPRLTVDVVSCKDWDNPLWGCFNALLEHMRSEPARIVDIYPLGRRASKVLVIKTMGDGPWPRGDELALRIDDCSSCEDPRKIPPGWAPIQDTDLNRLRALVLIRKGN